MRNGNSARSSYEARKQGTKTKGDRKPLLRRLLGACYQSRSLLRLNAINVLPFSMPLQEICIAVTGDHNPLTSNDQAA